MVALWCPPVSALQFDEAQLTRLADQWFGPSGVDAIDRWLRLLEQSREQPEQVQLKAINQFWNSEIQDQDDYRVWQRKDYWATPLESLGRGLGDCEDFALGKYFSLVHLGVAPEKLRFIYVQAKVGPKNQSIAHMVLGYYPSPDADPLVLDNLKSAILPASRRKDLTPVFSFNTTGIFAPGAAPASVDRIGLWRSLLNRMNAQGLKP